MNLDGAAERGAFLTTVCIAAGIESQIVGVSQRHQARRQNCRGTRLNSGNYGRSSALIARRSSIARYPSATSSSGSVRSKTLPGSMVRLSTKSINFGR